MQTIKFGKVRAMGDPDRGATKNGTYYGSNVPNSYSHATDWGHRYKNTRGAWVKRG